MDDDDPFDLDEGDSLDLTNRDFELRWPRETFVSEARVIKQSTLFAYRPADVTPATLPLEEAFAGTAPLHANAKAHKTVREAAEEADELREEEAARAYYMQRVGSAAPVGQGPDFAGAKRRMGSLVQSFEERGYFDHSWGSDCVDDARDHDRAR